MTYDVVLDKTYAEIKAAMLAGKSVYLDAAPLIFDWTLEELYLPLSQMYIEDGGSAGVNFSGGGGSFWFEAESTTSPLSTTKSYSEMPAN